MVAIKGVGEQRICLVDVPGSHLYNNKPAKFDETCGTRLNHV